MNEDTVNRFVAVIACAGIVSFLQLRAGAQETFEVASIKRSAVTDLADVTPAEFLTNGRWSARGATISILLRSAYGLPSSSILGLPSWARDQRFDVTTSATSNKSLKQLQAMAQQLLSDRFGLRAHYEQRINEVYALVRTNPAGTLGPGLRSSAATCDRSKPAVSKAPGTLGVNPCGESITSHDGVMRVELRDRPLMDFLTLSGARSVFDRPIVDRTGLTGRFDINIEFISPGGVGGRSPEFGLPLAEAVVDQLGLRFERRQEPVEVLMVDRVTMPTPD